VWAPELIWLLWRTEKSVSPAKKRIPAAQPVVRHYTDRTLPAFTKHLYTHTYNIYWCVCVCVYIYIYTCRKTCPPCSLQPWRWRNNIPLKCWLELVHIHTVHKPKNRTSIERYILLELLLTHLRTLHEVALIFLPPRSFHRLRVRITYAKTLEIQSCGSFSWHYLRTKFREIRSVCSHIIKRDRHTGMISWASLPLQSVENKLEIVQRNSVVQAVNWTVNSYFRSSLCRCHWKLLWPSWI
jgi:hypothetical protein